MTKVRIAISTCPNDTFAFHGLMHRHVDWRGLDFEFELLDIQQLNDRMLAGQFDVIKGSYFAALRLADRIVVLPSGSALGFGVGPLLLAAAPDISPTLHSQLTLCPGELTTAHLLFQLFYPQTTRIEQTIFSQIMPRLKERTADFGVCIHEGRFTWQHEGLYLVEDLGTRWESETGCPLPLGGIFASNRLAPAMIQKVQSALLDSLHYARQHADEALSTMRHYAQEFDDRVLMKHVELYVNDWTFDLGTSGQQAIATLCQRAHLASLMPKSAANLTVV